MGNTHDSSFVLFDMTPQSAICPPNECGTACNLSPLSFDRVYKGHRVTSLFPLFQIPIELLPRVLRFLSTKDLKSLSLVDKDCWRLASTILYKGLWMNFTEASCAFLRDADDVAFPLDHHRIRSCVRRMNVELNSDIAIPFDAALIYRSSEPTTKEIEFGSKSGLSVNEYLNSVGRMIKLSLPNLHILDWSLPLALPSSILESIYSSPVRHLRLHNTILLEDFAFAPKSASLPLETLSLRVAGPNIRHQPFTLINRLLHHTAKTLRQLELIAQSQNDIIQLSFDLPFFPQLRSLIIDRITSECGLMLDAFLGTMTRVTSLSLDSATTSACHFYRSRGYMSTLRNLCWINKFDASLSYDDVMSFLMENTHLEAVQVTDGLPHMFLDTTLLPLFRDQFTSLTSLKLVWSAPDIEESSLRIIANISALRHLWLSAGNQDSFRNTWEVDPNSVIEHLSPLRCLESLAFSRDTYEVKAHPLAPRFCDYYATKAMPADVDITKYLSRPELEIYEGTNLAFEQAVSQQIVMRRIAWERWHAERMLELAGRLADGFTTLQWCFIGQLALTIDDNVGRRVVTLDSSRRDPGLSALREKLSINLWRPWRI